MQADPIWLGVIYVYNPADCTKADPYVGESTGLFSLSVTRLLSAIARHMNALNGARADLNNNIVCEYLSCNITHQRMEMSMIMHNAETHSWWMII